MRPRKPSVPTDIAADIERVVLGALSFPRAPTGARRQVQIAAGLGNNWGGVYRD